MNGWKSLKRLGIISFWLLITIIMLPQVVIFSTTRNKIQSLAELPAFETALVLGASVLPSHEPSPVLAQRIAAATELYQSGKVKKLLMSGDNSQENYDEVSVMRDTALALGVPEENILLDTAGVRTFDSCLRARDQFGLRQVIVVTQKFHLPRALYICDQLGMEVLGYAADKGELEDRSANEFREFLARIQSFFELNFFPESAKVLGEKLQNIKL